SPSPTGPRSRPNRPARSRDPQSEAPQRADRCHRCGRACEARRPAGACRCRGSRRRWPTRARACPPRAGVRRRYPARGYGVVPTEAPPVAPPDPPLLRVEPAGGALPPDVPVEPELVPPLVPPDVEAPLVPLAEDAAEAES